LKFRRQRGASIAIHIQTSPAPCEATLPNLDVPAPGVANASIELRMGSQERNNPMSRYRSIALIAYAIATLIGARSAFAETSPRLESCTQWDYQNSQFGFVNNCGEPVSVLFTQLPDQRTIVKEIKPGDRFNTGLTKQKLGDWMSTRCPVGFSPTVPFAVANKDAIIDSKYECVKR
jgi:hypothetical protein